MNQDLYEIMALGARYVFAGLMLLIVLRAWRITIIDSRRAGTLRRMSPQTGISGELVVLEGDGKARRGMKYPVIREGMIGTSRRADIRIRHGSVRRRHAYFQLTEDGLRVRTHAGAPMRDGHGHPVRALLLQDGAELFIGDVHLLLVLSQASESAHPRPGERHEADPYDDADDPLDVDAPVDADDPSDADDPFREQAMPRRRTERRLGRPIDVDEYFEVDEDDPDGW